MAGRNAAEQAEKRLRHGLEGIRGRLEERVGGPARLQVIVLLAAVLGLDLADKGAVSAVAGGLKRTFDISNTEIGLLVSLVSLVGAVATLPVGSLVDRINRTRLLVLAISLWAVAMLVSGLASSYLFLLTARLFLGGVTAAAVPTVASLVGDFFPARERAAMYGYILAGELVGVGFGFLFAGEISSLIDWRWAFFALSVPSAALAWALWRYLPEPARGGQSWLRPGQVELESATRGQGGRTDEAGQGQDQGQEVPQGSELAREEVRQSRVEPHEELVLREDPLRHNLWWAVRYVLRIRTNLLLIVASALGYYFFSGVRTFAMIYITEHFGITRSTASVLVILVGLGGLAGVLIGGRLADHLLRRGWLGARILVPGSGLALTVACVAPAVWTQNLFLGLGLLGLGAACLGAVNPPLDSARLDIMHPRLWGRAESVRVTLRMTLEAAAPVLFGLIANRGFGGGEEGLKWTFLVMLIPLAIASSLSLPARRSYPRDVATASASVDALSFEGDGER